jgi:class 3 adenylate cyclase
VVTYLNTLFESLIETVNRHNGFVNKFLGDGFMAVFIAAEGDKVHCRNAVLAAIEISENVKALVADNKIDDTKIGMGIHSGQVVTGNIGSSARREFTIIGDVVNLASRLEQLTKQFEREILMSKEIADAALLEGLETEFVAEATIKGRETREKIYTLANSTLSGHLAASANIGTANWAGNPENVEVLSRNYRNSDGSGGFSFLSGHMGFTRSVAVIAVATTVLGLLYWLTP